MMFLPDRLYFWFSFLTCLYFHQRKMYSAIIIHLGVCITIVFSYFITRLSYNKINEDLYLWIKFQSFVTRGTIFSSPLTPSCLNIIPGLLKLFLIFVVFRWAQFSLDLLSGSQFLELHLSSHLWLSAFIVIISPSFILISAILANFATIIDSSWASFN